MVSVSKPPVLISNVASTSGEELAWEMAQAGHWVFGVDSKKDDGEEIEYSITANGWKFRYLHGDFANPSEAKRLMDLARKISGNGTELLCFDPLERA